MQKNIEIFSLSSDKKLVKHYDSDGITNYPSAFCFSSERHTVKNTKDLFRIITSVAEKGDCLVKGALKKELIFESRAGSTETNDLTSWVCFDIDKSSRYKTPDAFMAAIGLGDVSYVAQFSSSYGVVNKGGALHDPRLSCHIFALLEEPVAAPHLKQWLISLNFAVVDLAADLVLTRSNCALRYPLDITTCQNDKLLYVAPPTLSGGWKDTIAKSRIAHVKKERDRFVIPDKAVAAEGNKRRVADKVNELRLIEGHGARKKQDIVVVDGAEVLSKPDQATISGMKVDNGFVRFNLNGGDSWGYYHPEGDFDIIYNFKGEPNYLTKELLPEYYAQAVGKRKLEERAAKKELADAKAAASAGAVEREGTTYLAFRDFRTSAYYNGTWDGVYLDLAVAKGREQLKDFMAQHGCELGDIVPDWSVFFDPSSGGRVDSTTRSINLYEPPSVTPALGVFPTIERVIQHALNDTDTVYKHFINWLAFVVRERKPAGTAWVLHGVQGTGKGVMFEHIVTPLIGQNQAVLKLMDDLEGQYNSWMEHTIVCLVDEVQIGKLSKARTTSAKLKSWITEPQLSINAKYLNAKNVDSHLNWIFASNMPDPVLVEEGDRRFNVGNYQGEKIKLTSADIDAIRTELGAFLHYLQELEIDRQAVRTPIRTQSRDDLIELNRPAVDGAIRAVLTGNIEFLQAQLPHDEHMLPVSQQFKLDGFKAILAQWVNDAEAGVKVITRDQLQVALQYMVGDMPESPNKFTSFLKHHRVKTEKIWYDGKAQMGIRVKWVLPKAE